MVLARHPAIDLDHGCSSDEDNLDDQVVHLVNPFSVVMPSPQDLEMSTVMMDADHPYIEGEGVFPVLEFHSSSFNGSSTGTDEGKGTGDSRERQINDGWRWMKVEDRGRDDDGNLGKGNLL
jgi:hypothetical protein